MYRGMALEPKNVTPPQHQKEPLPQVSKGDLPLKSVIFFPYQILHGFQEKQEEKPGFSATAPHGKKGEGGVGGGGEGGSQINALGLRVQRLIEF